LDTCRRAGLRPTPGVRSGRKDRRRLAGLLQRRHRDHGVADPQRRLSLFARLGPGRNLEARAPPAWGRVTVEVIVGAGGKAVAASLDVDDQQLLAVADVDRLGQPPTAQ